MKFRDSDTSFKIFACYEIYKKNPLTLEQFVLMKRNPKTNWEYFSNKILKLPQVLDTLHPHYQDFLGNRMVGIEMKLL